MTVEVRLPPTPCALARVLSDHAGKRRNQTRAEQRLLTYSRLLELADQSLIPRGVGKQLQPIVEALQTLGLPYGLTLLVTAKDGTIDYGADGWYDIDADNALAFRRQAVEFDWSTVKFVPAP